MYINKTNKPRRLQIFTELTMITCPLCFRTIGTLSLTTCLIICIDHDSDALVLGKLEAGKCDAVLCVARKLCLTVMLFVHCHASNAWPVQLSSWVTGCQQTTLNSYQRGQTEPIDWQLIISRPCQNWSLLSSSRFSCVFFFCFTFSRRVIYNKLDEICFYFHMPFLHILTNTQIHKYTQTHTYTHIQTYNSTHIETHTYIHT